MVFDREGTEVAHLSTGFSAALSKGATQTSEGGIVDFPAPIHHSKAMLIDPKSGEPTRVRRRRDADGTVERIAVKSDQPIPRNR